jgi:two-component system, sensor histidine kinase
MQAMSLSPLPLGLVQALLVWAVFLQPESSWQYLVSMVITGIAAGSVSTAAGDAKGYAGWAVLVGGNLALAWLLLRGGLTGTVAALLALVLFGLLIQYVRDQGEGQEHLIGVNEALRLARERAEQANEARTRFFAAASHDLRQPLTALSYCVATVQALADQRRDEDLARVGLGLQRSLSESQGLLGSLLEVSQLDAGAIEPRHEPFDLGQLVRRTVESLDAQAAAGGLLLRAELPPSPAVWVHSDPALLRRILQNLVGNALKFTRHGEVCVRLERTGSDLRLAVIDTGPGIAPALQERVFEEFFQAGNRARDRSQGLGLGLPIVRRLANLLGLPLQLLSEPGRGCRFELALQAVAEPPEAAVTPNVPLPGLPVEPLRLLVVDDESSIRQALSEFLRTLGWQVRGAADLDDAMRAMEDGWRPQALVLDFRLRNDASGLAVLEALRESGVAAPAWLVTGDTEPQRIQQAREAGIPVLFKPVDGMQLAESIHRAVAAP